MKPIVTLTLNSSCDVMWEVEDMVPVQKLRASPGRVYPGGGGINVARVIQALGGETIAVCTIGSLTGEFLGNLLADLGLETRLVPISGVTRVSATCFERTTGHEYRITPPGPELSEREWRSVLDALADLEADCIVATGSLPRGVPNDFYRRVARLAKAKGARVVLDTSGVALFETLKEGVHVVKPNLRELEHLVGRKAVTPEDQEAITRQIVQEGKADIVALSLGEEGALLTWPQGCKRLPSPKVNVKSTVGAGDSFVAGLTLGLAQGRPVEDAFALGVAAGTATVMQAGTELGRPEDVASLYEHMTSRPLTPAT